MFSVAHESICLKRTLLPLTVRYCWVIIGLLCLREQLSVTSSCMCSACVLERNRECLFPPGFCLVRCPECWSEVLYPGPCAVGLAICSGKRSLSIKSKEKLVWSVFGHSLWSQWLLTAVGLRYMEIQSNYQGMTSTLFLICTNRTIHKQQYLPPFISTKTFWCMKNANYRHPLTAFEWDWTVLNQFIEPDRELIKLISSYAIFATEV